MILLPQIFLSLLSLLLFSNLLITFLTPRHPSPPPYSYHPSPSNPEASDNTTNDNNTKPKLRLREDGTFKVEIFSDLHYGEDEATFGPEQDRRSTRCMERLLGWEGPDLVVVDGDLITGENTHFENSTQYVHRLFAPMVAGHYPWASTYGNHDTQFNLSREKLFQEEEKYELSYTRNSGGIGGIGKSVGRDGNGVTNYWVLVWPWREETAGEGEEGESGDGKSEGGKDGEEGNGNGDGEEETPVGVLYFFDSQGGTNYQVPRWNFWGGRTMPNYVTPRTVSWFLASSAHLTSLYGVIPSLAFVHIPPTAFLEFQKQELSGVGGKGGRKDGRFPGLNDEPVSQQGEGRWGVKDRAFMDALKQTKGLHSVYSGHDHGDSWCGVWPSDSKSKSESEDEGEGGPKLCFVKHTGYGGYGEWRRGSRVLNLGFGEGVGEGDGFGMKVDTWVRLEEGDVVQRVSLNQTYGVDVYPSDDGEER